MYFLYIVIGIGAYFLNFQRFNYFSSL